jgi:hypothetical protein
MTLEKKMGIDETSGQTALTLFVNRLIVALQRFGPDGLVKKVAALCPPFP